MGNMLKGCWASPFFREKVRKKVRKVEMATPQSRVWAMNGERMWLI